MYVKNKSSEEKQWNVSYDNYVFFIYRLLGFDKRLKGHMLQIIQINNSFLFRYHNKHIYLSSLQILQICLKGRWPEIQRSSGYQ